MTLIRWQPTVPARDPFRMRSDIDRLFESVFVTHPARGRLELGATPAVDVEENAAGFVFRVDLPGVSQPDVKVSLHGDTLTIRGERKLERDEKSSHRLERFSGAFERTFTLAVPVRGDQVKAIYRDGVLEVSVPKAEEARAREIEVQVAKS